MTRIDVQSAAQASKARHHVGIQHLRSVLPLLGVIRLSFFLSGDKNSCNSCNSLFLWLVAAISVLAVPNGFRGVAHVAVLPTVAWSETAVCRSAGAYVAVLPWGAWSETCSALKD